MKIGWLIALSVAMTGLSFAALAQGRPAPKDALLYFGVCTKNLIRVDGVMESPKLAA
jgi:hypothetical protein